MKSKYIPIILFAIILIWVLLDKAPEPAPAPLAPAGDVAEIPAEPVIPAPPAPPAPIVGENPEGEANPSVMKLDMNTWQWISATYNNGTTITPKSAGRFTLSFKNDGTFSAGTDCNGVGGKYTANGNKITFSEMMSTLMYCEGSQEGDFHQVLRDAESFRFTSRGELIFDLRSTTGSGSATFR